VSILDDILSAKRSRVAELRRERPWSVLEGEPLFAESRRSLATSLRRADEPIRFLCEIKRASPSAGPIREEAEAVEVARAYAGAGASGISLVTEEAFFRGRPGDLPRVRPVGLPVLMKDFMIDPFQVTLARSLGADAILLIAAVRDRPLLQEIRAAARELGLEVLVEVHEEAELDLALGLETELVGVNNRDLRSFAVDLGVSEALFPLLPPASTRLAESGIRSREDVLRLERCGFDGLLVGESLMRAPDPGTALRELRGEENGPGGPRRPGGPSGPGGQRRPGAENGESGGPR